MHLFVPSENKISQLRTIFQMSDEAQPSDPLIVSPTYRSLDTKGQNTILSGT